MKKKDSFIFYRSFFDAIIELPDDVQLELFQSITNYALNQVKPNLTGMSKMSKSIFILIEPQIKANYIRFQNGCKGGKHGHKGGRPETPRKPLENPKETPNVNVNVNVNDKKKVNQKKRNFKKPTLEQVKTYCSKRQNEINAEKFMNYYQANGWKVGNNPMKNWEAAVRKWEQNDYYNNKNEGNKNEKSIKSQLAELHSEIDSGTV